MIVSAEFIIIFRGLSIRPIGKTQDSLNEVLNTPMPRPTSLANLAYSVNYDCVLL